MLDQKDVWNTGPMEQLSRETEGANVSPGFDKNHLHAVAGPENLEQVGDQRHNDTRSRAVSRDDVRIVEAFSVFRIGTDLCVREGRKSFESRQSREKRGQPGGPERLVNLSGPSDLVGVPRAGILSVDLGNTLLKAGHCDQRVAIAGCENIASVHILGWAERLANELHHLGSVATGAQDVAEVSSRKATDVGRFNAGCVALLGLAGGLGHIVILQKALAHFRSLPDSGLNLLPPS
jgi:hypothetical protein